MKICEKGHIFDIIWPVPTKLRIAETLKTWKRCSETWTMHYKKQNGNNLKNKMAIEILVNCFFSKINIFHREIQKMAI